MRLVVAGKREIAEGVAHLTLRDPGGAPLPPWTPGAHVDLVLTPALTRPYSLCGDPADRTSYELAVRHEPAGRGGSRHVHEELAAGDELEVRGPRNEFELVPAGRYLFVAGGIGITPILPMIAEAESRGVPWRLVYGGRTRASMPFLDRLTGDRVELYPQDETGFPDLDALSPGDALVYCCGPSGLVDEVVRRCPPGSVRVERFTPREDAGAGPRAAFEVELARSGRALTVPADRSILSVLEEAGVPVLSSCQEGTCGTCETDVLGGVPDHRDSLLTPEERAAGDTMMICVSRSLTPRLVLDL
ncbi:PDR/VanB family oxidoreductase [Bailinhaonella thermotolerans]|uniref:Oxidoreductase n=1 Tax=Bailinhaonella thermotolerans TaxID=1070861 RepID=A0A3A4A0Z4_9ACTN|nr:PDR/VanB family oxidoreductase [Bailinhaonella thermotolerans]RJL22059.1 oxidoreductase [Bailinhaonella thermotolerans]